MEPNCLKKPGGVFKKKKKKGREGANCIPTGHSMIPPILRPNPAVSVAVKSRHGFLREEGERFAEDCFSLSQSINALVLSFSTEFPFSRTTIINNKAWVLEKREYRLNSSYSVS